MHNTPIKTRERGKLLSYPWINTSVHTA